MIYRFRIILDAKEDVIRDIEIEETATLEDFHNVITQAYGFEGQEMASFYTSNDEWEQEEEIPLFDMSEVPGALRVMSETLLQNVVSENSTKLIYVYDFLTMWTFLVELAEIAEPEAGMMYPNLMFAHGEIPDDAPHKKYVGKGEDDEDDDVDDFYDDDEFDLDPEDYDTLDFDENWN
ncbi:IS1096 element passenger TnpR family protein [Ulvibacter litoralis]|uniref:PRiA4b ORF-3-like protein n=1 Tax=Ulvibacter litoralis TaxID=227084 RepID=A0A1G7ENQ1_9FLAO|nr:hypothetical protein [Ulvibacter litoralis]GHC54439.1 hypothetical protein GCM10008083_18330 [Ulvibacter litoralis]SDE65269.1 pRiA4b ORF-3-like protein [Ulvibacter litoralis]